MVKENQSNNSNQKWIKPVLITTAAVVLYILFSKDTAVEYEEISSNENIGNGLNVTDLAQKLHDAMKYTGTNFEAILDTLASIDEHQYKLIERRFGKRAYNSFLGNQTRVNPFSPLPKLTLKQWFKHELSEKEYKTLQTKYPNSL